MWLMSGSASVAFIIAHAGASGDPIRPQYLSARVSSYARGRPKVQAKHMASKRPALRAALFASKSIACFVSKNDKVPKRPPGFFSEHHIKTTLSQRGRLFKNCRHSHTANDDSTQHERNMASFRTSMPPAGRIMSGCQTWSRSSRVRLAAIMTPISDRYFKTPVSSLLSPRHASFRISHQPRRPYGECHALIATKYTILSRVDFR